MTAHCMCFVMSALDSQGVMKTTSMSSLGTCSFTGCGQTSKGGPQNITVTDSEGRHRVTKLITL